MNNFDYKNPTKIIFGKDTIKNLATEIPKDAKILMLFGGGSIKKNGVYEQVTAALKDFQVTEMGGIPPNPEYDVLIKAIDIIKSENITYLLAVGGGSVIDGTKFISAAALYEGDPWDMVMNRKPNTVAIPFGAVLTLPATGSEMNSGAVITRRALKMKIPIGGPALFPQFSILDPTVVRSIPSKQIANGLADSFTHVLEQYVTFPIGALLQDRFSESVMQTIIEVAPKIMADPNDYQAASNFMWSCTMALNGLLQKGVPTDWAIHAIGHELTALYNIDHARTLAIITKSHYTFNFESKKEKLAQLAERVFAIKVGDTESKAIAAIEKIDAFYHSIGIATKLSEYVDEYEGTAELIEEKFTKMGMTGIGENKTLTPENVKEIVKMSY
ncbi:NADH-dependent alcohol dehydrogenase [Putridiphycobacter roseus]|uniref:NADH-dependent alcohol dehydrogenase n=1 Tax=Putridiphycobacter roseus TaxID=2219161 RepID=A0A2W1NMI2_9FLAO|nr:iron-containing alcohol dehydrogenase [Putridiphycobacter roseus]PZE16862.1 NADH-dependent alcohol dehydrogenase [Putridiphycobacter roseus]